MDGGYDVSNFFKIDEKFGTLRDFNTMLRKFHEANIRVVLDLVPGHTSEKNDIFLKSSIHNKNYYSDMFVWSRSCWEVPQSYRFVSGRYERDGNYMVNFFSTQPALNYGFGKITEPWQVSYLDDRVVKTKKYLIKVIEFWLSKGVDGFRVDMAESLVKNDENKDATSGIWRSIFQEIRPKYKDVCFISEWSGVEAINKAGFDADFMLNHPGNPYNRLLRFEQNESPSVFNKNGKGDLVTFIKNYMHWYNQIKDKGLIGNITCNHDFDRLRPQYSISQCKIIISFLIFLPGVPFIYYGDEIGMKFVKNMANVEGGYSRTGTRIPMYWDNSTNYGFSSHKPFISQYKSQDNASKQIDDPSSLYNVVRQAINTRKNNDDFLSTEVEFLSNTYPIIVKRKDIIIITNPTNMALEFEIALEKYESIFRVGKLKGTKIYSTSLFVFKKKGEA
jgi:maltose alpha-D-glucosyltransferase/alpha-amylase